MRNGHHTYRTSIGNTAPCRRTVSDCHYSSEFTHSMAILLCFTHQQTHQNGTSDEYSSVITNRYLPEYDCELFAIFHTDKTARPVSNLVFAFRRLW